MTRALDLARDIAEQHAMRVQTSALNRVLADAQISVSPPSSKGRKLKLYYATQASVRPPTFIIFVNDQELSHFSYERYLENQLREAFGFQGTPIRIRMRTRGQDADD
ncbi:hypothetical protein GCM10025858_02520 [Alicyclobacillus sacchari]|nr:hypothetical protein GCM10025858_02520 [Alicyclobacillus sacchari]